MAFRQFYRRPVAAAKFDILCWLSPLLLAIALLTGTGSAATAQEEVECSSLRLEINTEKYDATCEVHRSSEYELDFLEANAVDGSHFLVVIDHVTHHRYIFPGGGGLQKGLKDYFSSLDIKKWTGGDMRSGFRTAEFTSDFKSIPSACVGFERYLHKEIGGWRRRIIGFGCSRNGDREEVYKAMEQVNFPE